MTGQTPAERAVLPVAFYERPVLEVAADLLGCVVRYGGVGVRLTEVEAYDGPTDPGSHAFRGRTPRTEVMFGPPGHLYVYFSYGMHHCANLVTGPDGQASAVLLRAGEVVEGLDVARERVAAAARARAESRAARTGTAAVQARLTPDRDLAKGPARLTRVLGLTLEEYGIPVTDPAGAFVVSPRDTGAEPASVRTGPRVGVSGEGGDARRFPWRFWLDGDATVSTYRPAVRRRRRADT